MLPMERVAESACNAQCIESVCNGISSVLVNNCEPMLLLQGLRCC